MKYRKYFYSTLMALLVAASASAQQSSSMPDGQMHPTQMQSAQIPGRQSTIDDARQWVNFPEKIREHELWSMRDHLQTIHKIQRFLADEQYEKAADLAETRLGFSSFKLHGAKKSGKYMPKGMQKAGMAMHRSASRFAKTAMEASVSGGLKMALSALATLTSKCVACHGAYRLR